VVTVKASQKIFTDNEVGQPHGDVWTTWHTREERHLGFMRAGCGKQPEFRRISGLSPCRT